MKFDFIPLKSVGKFKFNTHKSYYIDDLNIFFDKSEDEFGGSIEYVSTKEYFLSKDHSISISFDENNILSFIFCYDNLWFKGVNLIGLTVPELENLFQMKAVFDDTYDFEDDGYPQSVYEIDEINMQIWKKKGYIVAIIVDGIIYN